jgi:hypothetical protein
MNFWCCASGGNKGLQFWAENPGCGFANKVLAFGSQNPAVCDPSVLGDFGTRNFQPRNLVYMEM